jgi:hypothetical protein
MSFYLLDIHDTINRIFGMADGSIEGSFSGLTSIISTTANGIAGVGVTYAFIRIFMNFYANQEWDAQGTIKLCLLVALYGNCVHISKVVDRGFKSPGMAIESALAVKTDDGEKIYTEYREKYMEALDKKANEEYGKWYQIAKNFKVAISTMVDKMMVKIWFLIVQIVQLIMELVLFFFKLAGSMGSNLLLVFVPLSFALSFIPGFDGSGVGILKFIMTFRLWGAVAAAIKYAAFQLGFFSVQADLKAMTDAGYMAATGPDWGVILIMLCFIFIMALTPMFADALITGSQAGSILSAASGYAMSKVVNPGVQMVKGAAQGTGNYLGRKSPKKSYSEEHGTFGKQNGKAETEKIKKISS